MHDVLYTATSCEYCKEGGKGREERRREVKRGEEMRGEERRGEES
jgi:hypothetical protein